MKSWFAPLFLFFPLFCASCVPSSLSNSAPVTSYANNTDIPENLTIIAKSPTPQEGVQEPTFVDVPFLSPTEIVPSPTLLTPEVSLTPTLMPTEIQPSATATSTATQEASPTPDGLWCSEEIPYLKTAYKLVEKELKKDPNTIPILDILPSSIGNIGDNPNTEKIEKQQCVVTVGNKSELIVGLKKIGFSETEIQACLEVKMQPLLPENKKNKMYGFFPENTEIKGMVEVGPEGKGPYSCLWENRIITPERRNKLEKMFPYLK